MKNTRAPIAKSTTVKCKIHIFFSYFIALLVCKCASVEGERENVLICLFDLQSATTSSRHACNGKNGRDDRRCRNRKHSHTRSANTIYGKRNRRHEKSLARDVDDCNGHEKKNELTHALSTRNKTKKIGKLKRAPERKQ